MRCPYCHSEDSQVKDSRSTEDGMVIRRRRICVACERRFTTFERVQLRALTVIKNDGRRVPFEREKLMRSLEVALRKRNIEAEHIEKAISDIVRCLEDTSEGEVHSEAIGRLVMEALKQIDAIAYIRFASVYRNFRTAQDFHKVIDELSSQSEPFHSKSLNDGAFTLPVPFDE
ncbi:transcriptional regulator NrdR [Bartonella sp. DGB2]|uniref:transcriptional regulator NrdR n=1 Tax=Bartonella sp. DGB2 TaxID=3388426 RepID=UPI00398F9467